MAELHAVLCTVSWLHSGACIETLLMTWADGLFRGCAVALGWKAGFLDEDFVGTRPWPEGRRCSPGDCGRR